MPDFTQVICTGLMTGFLQGLQIFFHAVVSSPVMIILIILLVLRRLIHKPYH